MTIALALIALTVARRGPPLGRARVAGDRATETALARALFVLVGVLALLQLIAPYFTTTGLPHLWWIVAGLVVGAAADRS
jgi:predicted membrane channel-forming protein YqfA (hemolysin III family)